MQNNLRSNTCYYKSINHIFIFRIALNTIFIIQLMQAVSLCDFKKVTTKRFTDCCSFDERNRNLTKRLRNSAYFNFGNLFDSKMFLS